MLDQTFSARNFKLISALENRKGFNCAVFFPDVMAKHNEVKATVSKINKLKKNAKTPYSSTVQSKYDALMVAKKDLMKERDKLLFANLEPIAKTVSSPSFEIKFNKRTGPTGKTIFVLPNDPASYYSVKLISRNLARLYKVRQANKNLICSQLHTLLQDGYPYYFIRLDISNFYESIDQNLLIEKLEKDGLLNATSLRLIKRILKNYSNLSGTADRGLPRGIGSSAYLSELYLRDFDNLVRKGANVIYYARYVDDIIVGIAPPKGKNTTDYDVWIEQLLPKFKLEKNITKSDSFNKTESNWVLKYLGYKFEKNSNNVKVNISDEKHTRYENRLKACFDAYEMEHWKDTKAAHRLLVRRLKFLTGNTKLKHTKKNAYVGIFFTNPLLNNFDQLVDLDQKKTTLAARPSISTKLKAKLDGLSFETGFKNRSYYHVGRTKHFGKDIEFEKIVSAWKYVP